jgi:hypothetical protein
LSEYDDILEKARKSAEQFRSTAKEFIPKMYKALRNEKPNISSEDARDRIEKDCVEIWSRRTIIDALPDEAKNQEKQKAGRLRQKEHNSAAFSAAPSQQQEEEKKKIVVAAIQGKSIEEGIPLTSDISASNSSRSVFDAANANSTQTGLEKQINVSELKECSSCQELKAENIELREALRKVTRLTTADQISQPSSSSDKGIQIENNSSNLSYFEFPLPLEDVRQYIIRSFNVYKIRDQIWFNGTIDKSTGKVLTVATGRKLQQSTIEDSSKDHSSNSNSNSNNGSSYYRFHH